ncbi:hypothetical protein H181DRAFT_03138 [Streptomyces sp. WMMB 714]|uniref:hypothetical protein n=1 Tax=Streptomyces sp. WMMB 714 TaxID=1286822 RepID=UPI0005F887C8|nr:hypothetical protein [Streptomyces sp. WMMB 714]SCK37149.1 hypothetical protein H181DRAFT_03138 [Streptomyces sp. WMMB 714]
MSAINRWHASPQDGAAVTRDKVTGEIRIPLSLFSIDTHQGDVPLVLSRVEGELLHAALSRLLNPSYPAMTAAML